MYPCSRLRPNCVQRAAVIVNAEEDKREALAKVLVAANYTVLATDTSDGAVELCRTYDGVIHLLVADLQLCGASAWDLAQTAGRMRPGLIVLFLPLKETAPVSSRHSDEHGKRTVEARFSREALLIVTQALWKPVAVNTAVN